jgi:hypothetical protein
MAAKTFGAQVEPVRLSRRQAIILAAILCPFLVAAIGAGLWISGQIDGSAMDSGGYIAAIIGITATLALGIGLMGLVFYSSRYGYDDSVSKR